jgi:hypothetical protein
MRVQPVDKDSYGATHVKQRGLADPSHFLSAANAMTPPGRGSKSPEGDDGGLEPNGGEA